MAITNEHLQVQNLNSDDDQYFKSKQHRYIFALTQLDGENRAKILDITNELYNDKNAAKDWRDKIIKLIHPDICIIEGAGAAIAKLNELYSRMIEDE